MALHEVAFFFELRQSLIAWHKLARIGNVLLHEFLHFLFDFLEVLGSEGRRAIEIVEESALRSRAMSLSRAIANVDPEVAISELGPMEDILKSSYYAGPQFTLIILGTFGITGLLLVVIGIFGVMAYTVSLQTHEIGIRMAMGAQRGEVLRMVLKKGLTLILAGAVAGLVVSSAVARLIASQIWGVSTTDPWTLSIVATVVIIVGLTASLFPARRATQVDPLVSLHYE